MKRLHIGLSTTPLEPSHTGGLIDGIGVYTRALLYGLPKINCAVSGYSYHPPFKNIAMSVGHPLNTSFHLATLCDLLSSEKRRKAMPVDLFHATDYRVIRMSCPVVATLHDVIPLKYPEWCSPRLRGVKNFMQKKAAKIADHVIAISQHAVPELIKYFGIDERRISVVPCGIGKEWQQHPSPESVTATLNKYRLRAGYFLFVGTLQPRKNIDRILDAYLQLPPTVRAERQLVIVGHVGWQCESLLAKIHATIQNGENVTWLNNIGSMETLQNLYAGACALVFPSLYEGFGIPVVEAFASGVPVITSNTTALPEVSQGAALEINPLSVGEIYAAMLALARDDALRARCIESGRRRADELTWEASIKQTAAVYRAVLSR